jgi:transcription elongation factor Elf1
VTENAPPQHHNEVKAFDVCSSCGAARKARATKCDFCKADHTSKALTPPRFDDELWVQIETTFQCRTCGFSVPLNHLEMSGAVVCGKCGAEQAFEVKGWHDAFDFAHSTADYGPGSNGWGKTTFDTGNQFTILTVAGHPLCETCHGLLSFTAENGKAEVSCGACKTAVSYVAPERAVKMTHGALRAVVSPEHRADHNEVKVVETGAAVAIHCPQCEAPLDASAGTKFIHCKYCNTTSRIPDDVWFRVNGNEPKPIPIWLAFSGMSPERRLEIKKKTDEQRSLAHEREIEEEKQKRALAHAQQESAHEAKIAHQKQLDEESAAKNEAIKKAKEKKQTTIVLVSIFGISILLGIISVVVVTQTATPETPQTSEPTQAPKPTPPPTHAVDRTPPALHTATPAHRH